MGNITLVRIETTSRLNDCLETGGVCGQVVGYNRADVERVLGAEQTQDLIDGLDDGDSDAAGYECCTVREVLERELEGKIIKRGKRIE